MKGWSQLMAAAAHDLVAELKRLAPNSPTLIRAETIFDIAKEAGVKPSGRPPSKAENKRRELLLRRLAERDASDAEVKRLYESGLSLLEVGKRMGDHSAAWVTASLARTGTPTRPRGNHSGHPDQERIERVRAMRAEHKTLEEIGAAEHVSRERVRQICLAAGISTAPDTSLSEEQLAAVGEYLAGHNMNFVAERYGVGTAAVRKWIVRAGYVPRPRKRDRDPATLRRAKRAAQLYGEGMKAREIADDLGVSKPENVYRLLAIAGVTPNRNDGAGRPQ